MKICLQTNSIGIVEDILLTNRKIGLYKRDIDSWSQYDEYVIVVSEDEYLQIFELYEDNILTLGKIRNLGIYIPYFRNMHIRYRYTYYSKVYPFTIEGVQESVLEYQRIQEIKNTLIQE